VLASFPPRAELFRAPLATSRLTLRPLDLADILDFWSAVQESRREIAPWLPWEPFVTDLPSAQRYLEATTVDWDTGRAARFAIRDSVAGGFLGVTGVEVVIPAHYACEVGYWVRSGAHRQGVATEATHAIVQFAYARLGANRVRAAASTENPSSIAVIRKLGFRFEGVARQAEYCNGRFLDHAIFARLRGDPPNPAPQT
jgi:ribosomal-protein-serine acetyltransferase